MKKILLLSLFIMLIGISFVSAEEEPIPCVSPSNDYFYYYFDEVKPWKLSTNEFIVDLAEGVNEEEINEVIEPYGEYVIRAGRHLFQLHFCIGEKKMKRLITALNEDERVVSANFVLYNVDENNNFWRIMLTDDFSVRLKEDTNIDAFYNLNEEHGVEIITEDYGSMERTYMLKVNRELGKDSLEIANLYYETGLFVHSEPNPLFEGQIAQVREDDSQKSSYTYYYIIGAVILVILIILFLKKKK